MKKILLGKKSKYAIDENQKVFHSKEGVIKIQKNRKIVKSHLGDEFSIVEPTLTDFFEKILKRGPQVILPKDSAMILAYTGIRKNTKIVDAGAGSAFLSIFLAWYLQPCKITAYEINDRFYKLAKENVRKIGLEKYIKIKKADIRKGIDEKTLDLITLDLEGSEKVVKHAYESLKVGGWLVVYCPYIESVLKTMKEIKKYDFGEIKIIENIVREWRSVKGFTRPKTTGIIHTGFLIFARKIK